jgi:hypothetical protein
VLCLLILNCSLSSTSTLILTSRIGPRSAVTKKNSTILRNMFCAELEKNSSMRKASDASSEQEYVDTHIMPMIVPNIISTRPLLWTSLLKCRQPGKPPAEIRRAVLDALQGEALLEAIERLDDGRVDAGLGALLAFLTSQLPELEART